MRLFFILLTITFTSYVNAQNAAKKILGHEELITWNNLQKAQISNDGRWVVYELNPEEGDGKLIIHDAEKQRDFTFPRGMKAQISADNQAIVFQIKPHRDSLLAMRRRKVDEKDLPKDSLTIFHLDSRDIEQFANIKSYKMPEKWGGWLAMLHEPMAMDTTQKDTLQIVEGETPPKKEKVKKENKKNGHQLTIRSLNNEQSRVVKYVTNYDFSEEGAALILSSTGDDSTFLSGVYHFDTTKSKLTPLFRSEGDFKKLTLDKEGDQAAFLANLDTTNAQIAPFELFYWKKGLPALRIADNEDSFLGDNQIISQHQKPMFSEDGNQLYFGVADQPLLQDTSLLKEEIVNVEVWHYKDPRLHTQQKVNAENDKKRSYRTVYNIKDKRFVRLGSANIPRIRLGDEGNANWALGYNETPYQASSSWEGFPTRKDIFLVNTKTGQQRTVGKNIMGNPRFSPLGDYVFWYSAPDSTWQSYSVDNQTIRTLSNNQLAPFYDELNDRPMHPYPYSVMGWLEKDKSVLIYDRFDIWQFDPTGKQAPKRLTQGREKNLVYRYIKLDKEERSIPAKGTLLLHVFNTKTKASGYTRLNVAKGETTPILLEDYQYTRRILKAKDNDKIVYTKQSFQTFPDLLYGDLNFNQAARQISFANPQQQDYAWGSIELYEWTDANGQKLQGMLAKPANFDPNKKYPMIVNFYERSSDRLHRHPRPFPGRSTINYAFYTSRGYLIFNPDVPYRPGYPGESAFNAVIPGVTSLIEKGFVDREKIGLQGHSWGGYQAAYLVTKTDIFACAESGAPVVNMFSAYGGIRWGSGFSRMFQYEHTQSRIGGTIWEYPLRYLENSPIFFLDKVNTPVLILHNDKDGAVPWYQGIEFFVGMRRLGKPAWLLNYNDEPHWPVKVQNRKDFNIRMQQFFDHYLKDASMPQWMERGVPALEKGIEQGLKPVETKE